MIYAYDLEVYRNFFSGIFINVENLEHRFVFVMYRDQNDRKALVEFLNQPDLTLVGHNSLHYDDLILQAILDHPRIKPQNLKNLSDKLIDRDQFEGFRLTKVYKDLAWADRSWQPIDMMNIFRVNQQRIALKYAGIILAYHTIQDLPIEPGAEIQPEQVEGLLEYNTHDVMITRLEYLYAKYTGELRTREDATKLFGVNVLTANRTEIGKQVFNKIYAEKTNQKLADFRQLRTYRDKIVMRECLPNNIVFGTDVLKQLHQTMLNLTLYRHNRYSFGTSVNFGGVNYDIGIGGLHSRDKDRPGVWRSDNETYVIDADIASMYPSNQLNNNFFPEHLGKEFPKIFKWIVDTRLDAKHGGNKPMSDVLKIAINSEYGLTNSEYFWLYDPKVTMSVTISGQLYLLDLIEKLVLGGFEVISANTDGITAVISKKMLDKYKRICDNWSQRTNFNLEYALYTKYARRDVNNYIAIKKDIPEEAGRLIIGEIDSDWKPTPKNVKTKGAFVPGMWMDDEWVQPIVLGSTLKSYKYPIVAKALYEYFVNGVAVRETIKSATNIHDFVIAQRVDPHKFKILFVDENLEEHRQQKTNRFICTVTGGSLIKINSAERVTNLLAGQAVQMMNTVDSVDARDYAINYGFYIEEAQKIINKIEPKEVYLF